MPEQAAIPTSVELFRQAIENSQELHAQALSDMRQRSEETRAQLLFMSQGGAGVTDQLDYVVVQQAKQLDANFWPNVMSLARGIVTQHEESQNDTSK